MARTGVPIRTEKVAMMMTAEMITSFPDLVYNSVRIRYNAEGLLSLTDMWHAVGAPKDKSPEAWRRYAGADFIDFVTQYLHEDKSRFIRLSRGRSGGTWAHWRIALAYARYLSPAFYDWCRGEEKPRGKSRVRYRTQSAAAQRANLKNARIPSEG